MKDTHINIRSSEEVKKLAEQMAKDDNRTLSNFIEVLILEEYKKRNKDK